MAAVVAAVTAGCGRDPAPARTPDRATEIVSVTLFLDPARTDCVEQRFAGVQVGTPARGGRRPTSRFSSTLKSANTRRSSGT